jgi:N utilization substance protein A
MLGEDSSVEMEVLIEKVKEALTKAMKRAYPYCEDFRIDIDIEKRKLAIIINRLVVEGDPIDEGEINIDDARKINPDVQLDDVIETEIDTSGFGRAAAQSAKQSIRGDLREINRERILSQFADKENKCISAVVTQVEAGRGTVTVMHDKTELYLFENEQIPGEVLKEGQNIKVFVTGIVNRNKKPIIKISRAHRGLVKELFEMEIPEVADGTVEVMSVAREPGNRSKVAVKSNDPNVDAIGSCIGQNRSRMNVIVRELCGEKIDLIAYHEDPYDYIAEAIAPAEAISVNIIEPPKQRPNAPEGIMDPGVCTIIVPDNQLSLAIGNKGQNVKLAARLVGYKIDIKPQSQIETYEVDEDEELEQLEETE